MTYRLDPTIEKLTHALCELVVLRRRIGEEAPPAQVAILHDILQDVSLGLAGHAGVADPPAFAEAVLKAAFTWQVALAFRDTPGLTGFLCPPYFSMPDVARIREVPPLSPSVPSNPPK